MASIIGRSLLLVIASLCITHVFTHTQPTHHKEHIQRLIGQTTPPACPCDDKSLCRPLYRPKGDFAREKEVFGFVTDGGASHNHYDWTVVSTVAWGSDTSLICEAHKHGARVVMGAPAFPDTKSGFPETQQQRDTWIDAAIHAATAGHYDGLTFDYESPIAATDHSTMALYLLLVNQTTARFHEAMPGSQISVCVAWSPDDIDGRMYDYLALSKASDLFYLMVYDTRSQIYDQCIASANAPAAVVQRAIQRYTDTSIPPSKMVVGLPWYAYDYPCTKAMESDKSRYCPIKEVPFRGVNCSDAAGTERAYQYIMPYLDNKTSITGRMWDESMQTPFFNYQAKDGVHQVWYDDPQSLRHKYALARDAGFRGTGPYTFNMLDYSTDTSRVQAAAMWEALHTFTDPK